MKPWLLIIVLLIFFTCRCGAQFYFRGEVKDASNQPLSYVRIQVLSTNMFYYSGSSGSFGIPSRVEHDSVLLTANGYESKKVVFSSNDFNHVVLKISSGFSAGQKKKLLSFTKDKSVGQKVLWSAGGETYSRQIENEFNSTEQFPVTGFALNVDKASYSNIRRFINMNSAVPPDAVRIEEMLNYFPSPVKEVEPGKTFSYESVVTDCPWNEKNKLFFVKLHTRKISYDSAPPANLLLLIDVSGSMDLPNRLPLLKTAFRMMVQNLRAVDTVSIVTYGGNVAVALYPTSGCEQQKILTVIDSLQAGGETPGGSALRTAYDLIQPRVLRGSNNRIILASDGDFNVGEITEEALMQLVAQKQQTGINLTCLGVGMGNYKDSKLEALAKKGNGNFAYLDNIMEAEKVLVTESMQTFYVAASEAFLNINFDKAFVKRYRLIGYDNRLDALSDSTVTVNGGEMGSSHTVTAVFEIEPAQELVTMNAPIGNGELNYIPMGAKQKTSELLPFYSSYYPLATADSSIRFSTAVVLFGLLLKQSVYVNSNYWKILLQMLTTCINPNDYLQTEMQKLAVKAKEIYKPEKKRRRWFEKKKE
ncbi:MAG: VWA domain-containing protein [Chitinophagaceae bacterium]|nr:VWA domain-containing protein [Chitinophagaceae bacterium]